MPAHGVGIRLALSDAVGATSTGQEHLR